MTRYNARIPEINKMNAIEKGFISFTEYKEKHKLDKQESAQLRRKSLSDGINFILISKRSNDFYINPDYVFEKEDLNPDELFFKSFLKRYSWLDIQFKDKMIIIYGYVVAKNKQTGRYIISNFIDAVEFIYDKINEVIKEKPNNSVDFCPNHLTTIN